MAEAIHPLPPARRALVTIIVMAGMLMVILDTTIANVALPHMQAALSANPESISWVLTSYIIAAAIATPVTGWLAARFGRRLLFTVAVAGFTTSSALCGVSTSLAMMVGARLLQGLFGAFLAPLSQSIMYDINPPEKHAQAMTLWGMGVMVGPIAGPVLGGWLTDMFDWRWVFFINLPVGIMTTLAAWLLLPETTQERRSFDMRGFALLAITLIAFQLFLDRGTQLDWFDSIEIVIEAGVMVGALWMFVVHSATAREPLVPIPLVSDRTYVSALAMVLVTGGIMTAGATLLAPMLQRLLNYPVYDAGVALAPRGLSMMIGMYIANLLTRRIDARAILASGLVLTSWSLHMQTGFNLEMGKHLVLVSGIVQGFGMGLTVMPLNLLAFSTLSPALRTDGAAFYSLMRNIGGSAVIAITTALVANRLQVSHSDLTTHVTSVTTPFLENGIVDRLGLESQTVIAMLDQEINRQAMMIAYLDTYWLMMWAAVAAIPMVFIMRPPVRRPGEAQEAPLVSE